MSTTNAAIVPTVSPGQRLNVDEVLSELSLANGMTAGYGVQDGHNDNWPVDPTGKLYGGNRTGGPGSTAYGNIQRIGFIRNVLSVSNDPGNPTGLYTLYFMFNPNLISVNWQTNPAQGSPLYLYGQDLSSASTTAAGAGASADSSTVPSYATAQTVGWSLYFDRTYDMMYGSTPGGNPEDDRGVLKDVAALYNLMGTFIAPNSGSAVPFSTPCEVVFGQNGAGQLWGFTGYISTLQIQYGIFRHDMIPSRAEVDITLTATYVPSQVTPGGGASTNPTGGSGGSVINSLNAPAATSGYGTGLLGAVNGPPLLSGNQPLL